MESAPGGHGAGRAVVSSTTPSATGTGPGDLGQQSLACQRQPWSVADQAAIREVRQAGAHPTSSSSSPFLMAQSV